MVAVSLLCNEILVTFINFPAIFGLRHSQLLFKTQSCSSYKISLRLNFKLDFSPHLHQAHSSPARTALAVHTLAWIVVERRGMVCSSHNSSACSSTSPFSPPFRPSLFGPAFLYTIREEQKTLLKGCSMSILNSVSVLLQLFLILCPTGGHGCFVVPHCMEQDPSWNNSLLCCWRTILPPKGQWAASGVCVKASQYTLQSISWVVSLCLAQ